jgi:4-methyl-5(b-hydroxyethyl)-thiazole monophosphate biosynthesis
MIKALVLIANGSEEVETLFPVDVLRRAGVLVDLTSINEKIVVCSRNVSVVADKLFCEVNPLEYDVVVVPGGLNGSKNISNDEVVVKAISLMMEKGKLIASICAAPALVLAKHNLIKGRKATCYPGMEDLLYDAQPVTDKAVTDGHFTTSRGLGTAIEFSLELISLLEGQEVAKNVAKSVVFA